MENSSAAACKTRGFDYLFCEKQSDAETPGRVGILLSSEDGTS